MRYIGCQRAGSGTGHLYPAAAQFLGSEFQVNTYTTVDQYGPAVTADGSGNFVIVWSSVLQDGSSAGVFGQRFNSVGSPVGSELQINSTTTNIQRFPVVAADSSGNFVVAWQSNVRDGALFGVFGQRFDLAGTPVGSEFQVNSYTTNTQLRPAVAADGLDNFVVAWQSLGGDASSYGVVGQRFDSAGSPVGSEFLVNTYTPVNQQFPALAVDGAGNFVVTWESLGQDGASYGVFGKRFNSAGSQVGSEFQVNTYTTNAQRDPAVAADSSGNFVVAWTSGGQDGSDSGVFGQRLRSWIFLDDFEFGDVCAWSAAVGSGDVCPP